MPSSPANVPQFATTRWSLVLAAQGRRQEALAELCRAYWYPLYAYVRRRGHHAAEAEDLTQAFFARLLEKDVLAAVTPSRGRFRSFLLAACQNFLANEHERAAALKRGGGGLIVSLDVTGAEERYRHEPAHGETPERLFARRWALTLLARVLGRLREEYEGLGKGRLFDAIKGQLTGEDTLPYAALARDLGMTEGAIKTAVHRLRQGYGELLRAEIAETVTTPEEVDEEVRALFEALGTG